MMQALHEVLRLMPAGPGQGPPEPHLGRNRARDAQIKAPELPGSHSEHEQQTFGTETNEGNPLPGKAFCRFRCTPARVLATS